MAKRVKVISESKTGKNEKFHDNYTDQDMTKKQFVKKIEDKTYKNYHIRIIDGDKIPVSNPDKKRNNNLG